MNKTQFSSIFFPPEGNFDIDAGDGCGGGGWVGGWGAFRTKNPPKSKKSHKKTIRTRSVHTSGTFFQKCRKVSKHIFTICSIYRKYTESGNRIQNNNL